MFDNMFDLDLAFLAEMPGVYRKKYHKKPQCFTCWGKKNPTFEYLLKRVLLELVLGHLWVETRTYRSLAAIPLRIHQISSEL